MKDFRLVMPDYSSVKIEWADGAAEPPESFDPVARPSHYAGQGEIECITVLEQLANAGHDFRALNAIKYLWRYTRKGGLQDVRKAIWYLRRLAADLEELENPKG
jgi:hypothetical protein